jgi:hypothetical protein
MAEVDPRKSPGPATPIEPEHPTDGPAQAKSSTWRQWDDIADIFATPSDPEWASDLDANADSTEPPTPGSS